MLTVESRATVPGLSGTEITRSLLDCTDVGYQAWWPGVHLQLHPLAAGGVDHVGDVVFMDEIIGSRHVRMTGVIVEADPGRKIVWQLKKGIRLPVRLALELTDQDGGVTIRHTITAGWTGPGRLLDPMFRLYSSPRFAAAMDQHMRTGFRFSATARTRHLLTAPTPDVGKVVASNHRPQRSKSGAGCEIPANRLAEAREPGGQDVRSLRFYPA